ncbi:hypothetical protein ACU8KH_02310 [Lachancea thermotolerans]
MADQQQATYGTYSVLLVDGSVGLKVELLLVRSKPACSLKVRPQENATQQGMCKVIWKHYVAHATQNEKAATSVHQLTSRYSQGFMMMTPTLMITLG